MYETIGELSFAIEQEINFGDWDVAKTMLKKMNEMIVNEGGKEMSFDEFYYRLVYGDYDEEELKRKYYKN